MSYSNKYYPTSRRNNANISFNARRISPHIIGGLQNVVETDLVRFNQCNPNDIRLMKQVLKNIPSDSDFSLIGEIAEDFIKCRKFLFYGLVKHQKNYNKVELENVLGLAEVSNLENGIFIDNIQSYCAKKGIGTAMMNGIINKHKKNVELFAEDDAIEFFRHYGFQDVENSNIANHMIYVF